MFGLGKLQETLLIAVVMAIGIYFVAIKPHYDLADAKDELQKQDKAIEVIKHGSDKKVFETKHEEIKKILIKKEIKHEKPDINFTVGKHRLIIK